jgi:small neutral amino acid transporter SnatA (MarC family)
MFWRVLGRLLAVVVFAIAIQIGVAGLRGYGLVS